MIATSASAQPLAGRPENYSHVVGRYKIAASVEPSEVVVEDPLTLRVVVTGEGELVPSRKGLRIFPDDFAASFFVEPIAAEDVLEKNRWEFVWRLKPKSIDVRELPSLALVYYSPQVRRYQTTRTDSIALDVKPRPRLVIDTPLPDDLPPSFFTLADRASKSERASPWRWLVAAAIVFFLCWALVRPARRTIDPTGFVASTIGDLKQNPGAAIECICDYFHRRLDGPAGEMTASDVDVLLKRAGVSRKTRSAWKSWWLEADATRFAPERVDRSLAPAAADLIRKTETELRPSRSHIGAITMLALTALTPVPVPPSWDAACKAFRTGVENHRAGRPFRADFAQAADEFAKAGNAELNLGNARFLAGQLPEAIAAFRAGFRAEPSNDLMRRHLDYARGQVALPPNLVRQTLPWYWALPESWLNVAMAVGLLAGAALVPIGVRRSKKLVLVGGITAAIGLAAVAIAEFRHAAIVDERRETIVVLRDDTPLRVGNSERYEANPAAPNLPRGYEVRVLDKRGDWLHVECPGGQTGWVPSSACSPAAAEQPGC